MSESSTSYDSSQRACGGGSRYDSMNGMDSLDAKWSANYSMDISNSSGAVSPRYRGQISKPCIGFRIKEIA